VLDHARPARPTRPARHVLFAAGLATAALLSLAACSASRTGYAGVAMDPAGRLLVVLSLCPHERLGALTLTDETTGTSITMRNPPTPPAGGSIILTGPIGDPRPEGIFDLLDRGHEYTLAGSTKAADSEDESGMFAPIRFKLDKVIKEPKLRQNFLLAVNEDESGTTLTGKDFFLTAARQACS
jgi:hypothetical protein